MSEKSREGSCRTAQEGNAETIKKLSLAKGRGRGAAPHFLVMKKDDKIANTGGGRNAVGQPRRATLRIENMTKEAAQP